MPAKVPDNWQEKFLMALADTPVVTNAATAAGVGRTFVYEERKRDEEFRAAWDDAVEQGLDRLEKTCFDRANEGLNDTLSIFILKNRRRGVYGEVIRNEHTGANGEPIRILEVIVERDGG